MCLSILFGYVILFSSSTPNIWTSHMLWSVARTLVFSKRISSMTMSITMGVLACKRYHGQSCIIIEDVWKSNYFLVQPLNKAAHEHCCQLSRNIGMEVIPKTILLVRNSTNSVSIDVDLTPMGGKVIKLFNSEKLFSFCLVLIIIIMFFIGGLQ